MALCVYVHNAIRVQNRVEHSITRKNTVEKCGTELFTNGGVRLRTAGWSCRVSVVCAGASPRGPSPGARGETSQCLARTPQCPLTSSTPQQLLRQERILREQRFPLGCSCPALLARALSCSTCVCLYIVGAVVRSRAWTFCQTLLSSSAVAVCANGRSRHCTDGRLRREGNLAWRVS
jgi:hypothetical protein